MDVVILAVLFVVGIVVGTQLNRGIYRLAWYPRLIGPWSPAHADAPPRRPLDRVPVVGWIGLARESSLHGRGFWVRPLLIELGTGACFAALYWHEVVAHGTVSPAALPLATPFTLQTQYLAHVILFSLMLVATFIDFDEQTIPDTITLPGTLLGLLFLLAFPTSRMLIPAMPPLPTEHLTPVSACNVRTWSAWLATPASLTIGVACFLAWCGAVVNWSWITRHGAKKAFQYLIASFVRRLSLGMVVIAVIGVVVIVLTWMFGNSPAASPARHWESLFGALVGMAAGGALIWAVRIVGGHALGQEAMGFGDVTLMAMIGAFLGWQAALMIFFLAPFAALFVSVSQWLLTRRRDIAFGPYLCVAACFLVVCWPAVWNRAGPVFGMGWFVPGVLAVGLALMGVMLMGLRWLKETLLLYDDESDEPAGDGEVLDHPVDSD